MQHYDAFGEKVMYGKKATGVIRSTVWIGPDGKVEKHWQCVANAAEHPIQVLQTLEEETSGVSANFE
jgi:thioredoxin-dependent peroxiredoxin